MKESVLTTNFNPYAGMPVLHDLLPTGNSSLFLIAWMS